MTKKKFLIGLLVLFLVVLLLFTFISQSIYSASLPVVTTVKPMRATLSQSMTIDGEFTYSDVSRVIAQDSWQIETILVENGKRITAGDALFTIDVAPYRVQRQNYADSLLKISNQLEELDVQAEQERMDSEQRKEELTAQRQLIKYQISHINSLYSPENYGAVYRENQKKNLELELLRVENNIDELDVQLEQADQKREKTRQELASQRTVIALEIEDLERRYPSDGIITAPADGIIDSILIEEGQSVTRGTECITAHDSQSDVLITYEMSIQDGEIYAKLSSVSVEFPYKEWNESKKVSELKTVTKIAEKHSRQLSEDGQRWEYQSIVLDINGTPVNRNARVTVSAVSGYYGTVLPANCVKKGQEDKEYVLVVKEKDSLFGKAYYADMVEVETEARSTTQVAVESKDYIDTYDIIETTTLPVYQGMTVLVR